MGLAAKPSAETLPRMATLSLTPIGEPMPASQFRGNLRGSLSKVLKEQPLILVAIGVAVGAAIAAALPRTSAENSLMGESSHSVRDAARGTLENQYEQLKSTASHVAEDIRQSIAEHGLTSENLSGLAHDVAEKAQAAAYEAGRSLDPSKA